MSEPIELFKKDGSPFTMYSPAVAEEMIAAGELFVNPPAPKPEAEAPKKKQVKSQE